jgi:hypothetical protein
MIRYLIEGMPNLEPTTSCPPLSPQEWEPKVGDEFESLGRAWAITKIEGEYLHSGSYVVRKGNVKPVPPPDDKPFQGEHWDVAETLADTADHYHREKCLIDLRDRVRELERLVKGARSAKAG